MLAECETLRGQRELGRGIAKRSRRRIPATVMPIAQSDLRTVFCRFAQSIESCAVHRVRFKPCGAFRPMICEGAVYDRGFAKLSLASVTVTPIRQSGSPALIP